MYGGHGAETPSDEPKRRVVVRRPAAMAATDVKVLSLEEIRERRRKKEQQMDKPSEDFKVLTLAEIRARKRRQAMEDELQAINDEAKATSDESQAMGDESTAINDEFQATNDQLLTIDDSDDNSITTNQFNEGSTVGILSLAEIRARKRLIPENDKSPATDVLSVDEIPAPKRQKTANNDHQTGNGLLTTHILSLAEIRAAKRRKAEETTDDLSTSDISSSEQAIFSKRRKQTDDNSSKVDDLRTDISSSEAISIDERWKAAGDNLGNEFSTTVNTNLEKDRTSSRDELNEINETNLPASNGDLLAGGDTTNSKTRSLPQPYSSTTKKLSERRPRKLSNNSHKNDNLQSKEDDLELTDSRLNTTTDVLESLDDNLRLADDDNRLKVTANDSKVILRDSSLSESNLRSSSVAEVVCDVSSTQADALVSSSSAENSFSAVLPPVTDESLLLDLDSDEDDVGVADDILQNIDEILND